MTNGRLLSGILARTPVGSWEKTASGGASSNQPASSVRVLMPVIAIAATTPRTPARSIARARVSSACARGDWRRTFTFSSRDPLTRPCRTALGRSKTRPVQPADGELLAVATAGITLGGRLGLRRLRARALERHEEAAVRALEAARPRRRRGDQQLPLELLAAVRADDLVDGTRHAATLANRRRAAPARVGPARGSARGSRDRARAPRRWRSPAAAAGSRCRTGRRTAAAGPARGRRR